MADDTSFPVASCNCQLVKSRLRRIHHSYVLLKVVEFPTRDDMEDVLEKLDDTVSLLVTLECYW